jgi:hypothetical protein
MASAPRTAERSEWRVVQAPVAFVIMLGGLVIAISPFLTWIHGAGQSGAYSYNLSNSSVVSNGAAVHLLELVLFVTAAVAIVVPLLPLHRRVAGITTLVVALAGLGVAIPEAVRFYRAYYNNANISMGAGDIGAYVAAIGFLVVIIGSIVYLASSREGTPVRLS